MLEEFTDFNHSVEKTGLFTAIPKNELYKLVAKVHSCRPLPPSLTHSLSRYLPRAPA